MNYWTYPTPKGSFFIVERSSRRVEVYFGKSHLGHHRSPVEAAERLGSGDHPALKCSPETGKTLGVPLGVHNWEYIRPHAIRRSFRK